MNTAAVRGVKVQLQTAATVFFLQRLVCERTLAVTVNLEPL